MTSIVTSASTQDPYVPVGTEEELAGPPHVVAPVQRAERISSIDTLRGFALLGILPMNIQYFSMIGAAYFNPTAYGNLSACDSDRRGRVVPALVSSYAPARSDLRR